MASYKDDQDAFFQGQDDLELESLKTDLRKKVGPDEADKFFKSAFALKLSQSQIIELVERMTRKLGSN